VVCSGWASMNRARANLQITVTGVALLLVVGGALWFGFGPEPLPPQVRQPTVAVESQLSVTVHVSGAVVRPGIATVDAEARVVDVIAAAGGATSDADLSRLNLAAPVRDGEQITVPDRSESKPSRSQGSTSGIDLNTASERELEDLTGVGPVLAAKIVAYRDAYGPFDVLEDLLDVPGIGEAKLAGMRDGIAYP